MKKIIFFSIAIILLLVSVKGLSLFFTYPASTSHYAVFLTNGQVYFGRIQKLDSNTLNLTDVYYLRANTSLQEQTEDQKEANVELSLIKLGNELHGPKDAMMINRANILFWEELRSDGKVMQAIIRHQR